MVRKTTGSDVEPTPALEEILDRCLTVLSSKPSGLATDIDGTISAIAPAPDAATVDPSARDALKALTGQLDLVAVVTGRSAADAERMLNLPDLVYVGNHGLERRWRGTTRDQQAAQLSVQAIENALAETESELQLRGISTGVLFENKRLSASIHFRLSPARDQIHDDVVAVAGAAAERHHLKLSEGRYVVEVRPNIAINKGTALLDLIEDRGLKGFIFLGDDVTDVDGFRVLREISSQGDVSAISVAVASPEARQFVLDEADAVVANVSAAVDLLSLLASRLALDSNRS